MSTLNEITGMIRRGIPVSIVSLNRPSDITRTQPDVIQYSLLERTYYLSVAHGIKKWKNIFLRTVYGQVKLFLRTNISFRDKLKVSLYSMKKESRRISLVHLVDLINHITAKKPTIIYFHFATHAGELIILRKIFNIPFIVFFHGFDFSGYLPLDDYNYPEMFRYADWFFANSNFAASKIKELGCPPGKLSVPGLPVDDVNYPFHVRIKKDKTRLLTVARLVEKKGLTYSIRAVAGCMKKNDGLEYDIIGDGPLRDELVSLVAGLGVSGRIRLPGSMRKDEVIRAMLDSDIFILTSITAENGETEGLGMVLLESQLTGMPVIATAHNGFVDAVRDGITGFLVPEKDVPAISEKLNWLSDHPETWAEMGTAGRKHVLENYSEKVYLDKILDRIDAVQQAIDPRPPELATELLAELEKSQSENGKPVAPYIFSSFSARFARPVKFNTLKKTEKGKVAIIVLNRNGEDHLEKLFKSFLSYNSYQHYEFILVDHDSNDRSREIISQYKEKINIRLVPFNGNFTYSFSNNYASGQTDAEYLFFLNNDIIFDQDVTGSLVDYMDHHPEAGIIAPVLYYPDENFRRSGQRQHSGVHFIYRQKRDDLFTPAGTFPPSFYVEKYDSSHLFWDTIVPVLSQEPGTGFALNPALCAAAMICRKKDFAEAGGFNENYIYGYEDIDLSFMICKSPGKRLVLAHDLGMIHNESYTRKKEKLYRVSLKIHNQMMLIHRFGYLIRMNYLDDLFRGHGLWTVQRPVARIFPEPPDQKNDEQAVKIKFLTVLLRDRLGWETGVIGDSNKNIGLLNADVLIRFGNAEPEKDANGVKDSLISVKWSGDEDSDFSFVKAYGIFREITPDTPEQDILRMLESIPGPDPFQQFILRRIANPLKIAVKSPLPVDADQDEGFAQFIRSLEDNFNKNNFSARVDRPDRWYLNGTLKDHITVSFTEGDLYYPQPGMINVLWITQDNIEAYLPVLSFFDLIITGMEMGAQPDIGEPADIMGNSIRKLHLKNGQAEKDISALTEELLAIHRQKAGLPH